MLKRIAHIIVSCWLALLLLFGGTPKEFIHLFASHEDTVHSHHIHGELSFENEHHHCHFLSFSLTPFIQQEVYFLAYSKKEFFYEYSAQLIATFKEACSEIISLRGPPTAC